jgi:hypothetical protein
VRQSTPTPKATSNGPGAAAGGAAAASAANGSLTVVLPPRPALQAIQSRTQKQLPLKPGRRVAFRVPGENGKALASPPIADGSGYEEAGWILATIHGVEKNGR